MATQAGLRATQAGLRATQAGFRGGGQTDGRTDRQMDGQKICPFYRSLSPIGAADPLQPNLHPKTV